jgi:hypothetical protein
MPGKVVGRDGTTYRDVTRISYWVWGILAVVVGVAGYIASTLPWPANLVVAGAATPTLTTGLIIAVIFSKMTTEVTSAAILSRFALNRFEMPLSRVRGVEVVEINPWSAENWGVRGPRINGSYLGPRGRGGVKLSLDDGKDMVLGSNRPADLAEAIRSRLGQVAPMTTSV